MNTMFDFFDVNAVQIDNITEARCKEDWESELKRRIQIEKARKELPVYYYRIYRRCFFELPVRHGWQDTLPVIVENIKPYPWEIWLMWSLRERWDTLLASAVLYEDKEAVTLLEVELDAAFEWDTYAIGTDAYLGTAHFAMCIYRYLKSEIFSEAAKNKFQEKSIKFLDKHYFPWFYNFSNKDHSNLVEFMHNIPVIMIFSGLALAEIIEHPCAKEVYAVAENMLSVYTGSKKKDIPFTEMAAYDAFALDSILEYLADKSNAAEVLCAMKDDLLDSMYSFIDTSVPGRGDILAPLGDVEPQMQFHSLVLLFVAELLCLDEAKRAFCMIPEKHLPAYALAKALQLPLDVSNVHEKTNYIRKNAGSIVLRCGEGEKALMCAVTIANWPEQHVHFDSGNFVLATKGCLIVTDPGYQQYINGEERRFTVGTYAHNAPIIDGKAQELRKCKILDSSEGHVLLDLTECYKDLPQEAVILREFKLDRDTNTLIVTDIFKNMNQSYIEHSFIIKPEFAVTVQKRGVMMSNGDVYVNIFASSPFETQNAQCCVPGSQNHLRLLHAKKLDGACEGKIEFRFVIYNDVL